MLFFCHFFVWPYTWCGWEAKVDLWAPKFFLSSLDFLELHEFHSLWRFLQRLESSKKHHFHVFTLCLLTKAHNPYRGWKCPIGSNNVTPVSLKPRFPILGRNCLLANFKEPSNFFHYGPLIIVQLSIAFKCNTRAPTPTSAKETMYICFNMGRTRYRSKQQCPSSIVRRVRPWPGPDYQTWIHRRTGVH